LEERTCDTNSRTVSVRVPSGPHSPEVGTWHGVSDSGQWAVVPNELSSNRGSWAQKLAGEMNGLASKVVHIEGRPFRTDCIQRKMIPQQESNSGAHGYTQDSYPAITRHSSPEE
jgi:hypothetical protein